MTTTALPLPASLLIDKPEEILKQGHEVAKAITETIAQQRAKYVVSIKGHDYLRVEAWQMFGAPFGISAGVVSLDRITDDAGTILGYEAHAMTYRAGVMLSSGGFGVCLKGEPGREDLPQAAGMAQTRAISRALRHTLAWVVVLAGYSPTPAEEMEEDVDKKTQAPSPTTATPIVTPAEDREKLAEYHQAVQIVADMAKHMGLSVPTKVRIWAAIGAGTKPTLAHYKRIKTILDLVSAGVELENAIKETT